MTVEEEGIMMGYVKQGRERWRIVEVYINGDIEQKLQKVEQWMEDREEGVKTIRRGDFNARTGVESGGIVKGDEMGEEGQKRRSKNRKLDREDRILDRILEFIEERGWSIFNGVGG